MALEPTQLAPALLPPRATTDGTLRRIQEEALVRFAERGYHGVSVREIADASGVRASSLYAHFPSKEQLLHSLILVGHTEHREMLRDALLGAGSDPADQLRAVMGAHVRLHTTYPVLATVANNELHALSESSAAEVLAIRDDAVRTIIEVIERGVRLGRFTCQEPWLATAMIGAAGIRVAAWFGPDSEYTVERIVDTYSDFALKIVT